MAYKGWVHSSPFTNNWAVSTLKCYKSAHLYSSQTTSILRESFPIPPSSLQSPNLGLTPTQKMNHVAIRSVKHVGKFLRLDAPGVTSFNPSGGGKALTQAYVGAQEIFRLHTFPGGTVSFESLAFPRAFLRLDGTNVTAGTNLGSGGGVVNAQYGSNASEKFYVKKKEPSPDQSKVIVGIESHAFPGRFLRMHKDGANVQGIVGIEEEFEILVIS